MPKKNVEPLIAKAFAHPLRVRILSVLNERVASPNLLSKELDESLNLVSYHVRVLEKYGCIELVETKPRRGATEHFYRATKRQLLSDPEWARFEGLEDRHLSRTPMVLDDRGWKDVATLLTETVEQLAEIQALALKRLEKSGEQGTPSQVEMLHARSSDEA
jgi:DNA-binding transcriptional ArsR family regulator